MGASVGPETKRSPPLDDPSGHPSWKAPGLTLFRRPPQAPLRPHPAGAFLTKVLRLLTRRGTRQLLLNDSFIQIFIFLSSLYQ